MWQRFTLSARNCMFYAHRNAQVASSDVGIEQLLYSFIEVPECFAAQIIVRHGLTLSHFQEALAADRPITYPRGSVGPMRLSASVRSVIQNAQDESRAMRDNHIGTAHLFIAAAGQPHEPVVDRLNELGFTPDSVRSSFNNLRNTQDPAFQKTYAEDGPHRSLVQKIFG